MDPRQKGTGDSLEERQAAAIAAFNRARLVTEQALELAGRSRETRMDAARRLEILRREHEVVMARSGQRLRRGGEALARSGCLRTLVAHRHPWFSERLVELLKEHDVEIVDHVDNGADAIGIVVAEQPDLVMVEDGLTMVPADEVIREMRRYCPSGVITAQTTHDRTELLIEAGADKVVTLQLPPGEVVEQALALLPRRERAASVEP